MIADANTVLQLDASTGAVTKTYHVQNPRTVVATTQGAIVVADVTQNGPVALYQLAGGSVMELATISGTTASDSEACQSAKVGRQGICFLVATASASLTLYTAGSEPSPRLIATIPASGSATLACGPAACYIAIDNASDGGLFRVATPDSKVAGPWGGRFPSNVAIVSDRVWTLTAGQGAAEPSHLQSFDSATGQALPPQIDLPFGDALLLAASAPDALWVTVGQTLVKIARV